MIKIEDFIHDPKRLQIGDIAEFLNVSHLPNVKIAWITKKDIRSKISNHLLYPITDEGVLVLYSADRKCSVEEVITALKLDLEQHVKSLVEKVHV